MKRYQLILKGETGLLQLYEHPGGSWVHHAEALPLATENMRLRAALMDLCNQVDKFCVEQGEWEFYTGPTLAALGESKQAEHERDLLDLIVGNKQRAVSEFGDHG